MGNAAGSLPLVQSTEYMVRVTDHGCVQGVQWCCGSMALPSSAPQAILQMGVSEDTWGSLARKFNNTNNSLHQQDTMWKLLVFVISSVAFLGMSVGWIVLSPIYGAMSIGILVVAIASAHWRSTFALSNGMALVSKMQRDYFSSGPVKMTWKRWSVRRGKNSETHFGILFERQDHRPDMMHPQIPYAHQPQVMTMAYPPPPPHAQQQPMPYNPYGAQPMPYPYGAQQQPYGSPLMPYPPPNGGEQHHVQYPQASSDNQQPPLYQPTPGVPTAPPYGNQPQHPQMYGNQPQHPQPYGNQPQQPPHT